LVEKVVNDVKSIHQLLVEHNVKGFLPNGEAEALYAMAIAQTDLGSLLEVGSFCGRSAVYLGMAAKLGGRKLFSVDHHCGSEEHQWGEPYHDPEHWDNSAARVDTLPSFRRTLRLCDLDDVVIPVITRSELLAPLWTMPLAMVFIDGGHSETQANADCLMWAKHLVSGGVMAIHDIFECPNDGGQAPYLAMQAVMAEYRLVLIERVDSLVFLRRQ
jgi:predicted O-methyltransferase YrrM